jgi:secreted PhoX family phosphatase
MTARAGFLLAALVAAGSVLAAASPAGAAPGDPPAGVIQTIAGGAGRGVARNVSQIPLSLAAGQDGAVYIGDRNGVVRELRTGSRWERTIAGVGAAPTAFAIRGGPATRDRLGVVAGLAVDRDGNVVVADSTNHRIRVVATSTGRFYGQDMTAGDLYTIAGTGQFGYAGDQGPAADATLGDPGGMVTDRFGNIVFADRGNAVIRVIAALGGHFYGQEMTAGDIYTVAGDPAASDPGDGAPATDAFLTDPADVTTDTAGNLIIADAGASQVRVVAVVAGTFYGQAMARNDIYTVAGNGGFGDDGDGGPATAATLNSPASVTTDAHGNLIIADSQNNAVRVVAAASRTFYGQPMTAGDIYTVAGTGAPHYSGDGGPATAAGLGRVSAVTTDSAGNLIAASNGTFRIRVIAASEGDFYGQAMAKDSIYTAAGNGQFSLSGNRGRAINAELNRPTGLAIAPNGNTAIFDDGQVRLVAAASGRFFGHAMRAGHIYALAGNGQEGSAGNGVPGSEARVEAVGGVAFDQHGNLIMADTGNLVRVIAAADGTFYSQQMTAGDVYTVAGNGNFGYTGDGHLATAASLRNPDAVAVDAAGNLLVADSFNNVIRVVATVTGTFYGQAMHARRIYTVAGDGDFGYDGDGGPATSATMASPTGIAIGPGGTLLIADSFNNVVRMVAVTTGTFYGRDVTAGDIYTLAGNGGFGFSGDGGPAAEATLSAPGSVAVDADGNLIIADSFANRVRVVAAARGTFYGLAMATGGIDTVAGGGLIGFSGDSGPATSARLFDPDAVAVSPSGSLAVADWGNRRVRVVR